MVKSEHQREFRTNIKSYEELEALIRSIGVGVLLTDKATHEDFENKKVNFTFHGNISYDNEIYEFYFNRNSFVEKEKWSHTFTLISNSCTHKYLDNKLTDELSTIFKIVPLPKEEIDVIEPIPAVQNSDVRDWGLASGCWLIFLSIIFFSIYGIYKFFST